MSKKEVKKTQKPPEVIEPPVEEEVDVSTPKTPRETKEEKKKAKTEKKHDILSKNLVTQFLYVLGLEDMRIHRWKLIWLNFMLGLARGLGFFLGAVVIGGLLLAILNKFIDAPVIGDFIAQIIDSIKGSEQ